MGLRGRNIRLDHGLHIGKGVRRADAGLDHAAGSPDSPGDLLRDETAQPTIDRSWPPRARLEIALTVCDGVLQISITVAKANHLAANASASLTPSTTFCNIRTPVLPLY
jgi:hypothetical protein